MKFEPLAITNVFKPVVLTLESVEEAAAIYAVLNHTIVSTAIGVGDLNGDDLRKALVAAGNDERRFSEIAGECHKELQSIMP